MRELGVLISNILENDLSKFYKMLGLIYFTQEKTLKLIFLLDGMFTTTVCSIRRGRFVNSAFPDIFARNIHLLFTSISTNNC